MKLSHTCEIWGSHSNHYAFLWGM